MNEMEAKKDGSQKVYELNNWNLGARNNNGYNYGTMNNEKLMKKVCNLPSLTNGFSFIQGVSKKIEFLLVLFSPRERGKLKQVGFYTW